MARITFSGHKQKIAEFEASELSFAQQDGGLLLTAEGVMQFQDTPSVENMLMSHAPYHVTIEKDGNTVIDQPFRLTFYTLEADNLAVLME